MTELRKDDLERFATSADRLAEILAKIPQSSSGNSNSNVTVQAGGLGVWIATTACAITCAVTLACGLLGAIWATRELARQEATNAELRAKDQAHDEYLSAIYMQAPHLKPKESK